MVAGGRVLQFGKSEEVTGFSAAPVRQHGRLQFCVTQAARRPRPPALSDDVQLSREVGKRMCVCCVERSIRFLACLVCSNACTTERLRYVAPNFVIYKLRVKNLLQDEIMYYI